MGEVISGERRVSTEAVMERAARAAAGLASLGMRRGDTLALYLRNDIAFFEASYAAGLLGAYATPVNWHYVEDEARYLFGDCGARVIVIHADLNAGVRNAVPLGARVLVVPTPAEIADAYGVERDRCDPPEDVTNWNDWIAGFEPVEGSLAASPGSIIYTSGTTGHPKGVMRQPPTPEQAAATAVAQDRVFGLDRPGTDGIITAMLGPMYHAAPNTYGLKAVRRGGTVILQPRFDAEGLLRLIERRRISHLHMVPIMFARLLKLEASVRRRYDLSSLRYVVHAAAPCPPAIKLAMIDWWGPVIHEYYASTETGMLTSCDTQQWLQHQGTVGRPLPEASVRVIGSDGQELSTGGVGEVVGRLGPFPDFTYKGDAEKRRAAEKGGLIAPGDIGYFDDDGFLYLCDRAKDMIISGGVNIYPAEIESVLQKMDGVADCAVFGIPDEEYGEAICAVVQPVAGVTLSGDQVKLYLRGHVAGYKVPRKVEVTVELPREDSGKIFKRKLRDVYWAPAARAI